MAGVPENGVQAVRALEHAKRDRGAQDGVNEAKMGAVWTLQLEMLEGKADILGSILAFALPRGGLEAVDKL